MRPPAPEPARYKELKGWKQATPMDAIDRGAWWALSRTPNSIALESRVVISNQTIAQTEAAYRTAQALVKEAQAGLFPTVTGNYANNDAHAGSELLRGLDRHSRARSTRSKRTPVRRGLPTSGARFAAPSKAMFRGAQLSAADIAVATLSAQATLATAYFNLRAVDALKDLLDRTAKEYQRTLDDHASINMRQALSRRPTSPPRKRSS